MTPSPDTPEDLLIQHLDKLLHRHTKDTINRALDTLPRNVQLILLRQLDPLGEAQEPIIKLNHEADLLIELDKVLNLDLVLFHLARVYDELWFKVFQNWTNARRGKPHDVGLASPLVFVELQELVSGLKKEPTMVRWSINFSSTRQLVANGGQVVITAYWHSFEISDLSNVPILSSLSSVLPGEESTSSAVSGKALVGIGTGGGSDVITTSLLGHVFRESADRAMDLIISTRSWRTGSQGKPGSGQIGAKREIYEHGGNALSAGNRPVPGTYRILSHTKSEGRDLETIPLKKHKEIWLVLDQGEEADMSQDSERTGQPPSIPLSERATLADQLYSIVSQYNELQSTLKKNRISTLIAVDTGGDVFGSLGPSTSTYSTPDQDKRTVLALTQVSPRLSKEDSEFGLTLAVLCPGLDSPPNMPAIVKDLGGCRYLPTSAERKLMIHLLTDEYHMDGRDHSRFGKSSLCLLAALQRVDTRETRTIETYASAEEAVSQGEWINLPLPEHVIVTRDNPWASFVWITDSMAEIIFVPMKQAGKAMRSI